MAIVRNLSNKRFIFPKSSFEQTPLNYADLNNCEIYIIHETEDSQTVKFLRHQYKTRIKSSDTCVFFAHSYQQPVLEGTKKDLFYAKYFAWHSSIETQIPDEKKSKLNEAYTGAKLKGTEGAPTHWMAVPDDWIEEGKFYLVPGCIEKLTLASSATQEDLPSNESLGFFVAKILSFTQQ